MASKDCYLICNNSKEKVKIPEGETTIGRGPFLKVRDKRVSRSHAIVCNENGCLKVKPIHTNPTFFWPGSEKYIILKQNEWKDLNNSDLISLLPNDLFFLVEVNKDNDVESTKEETTLLKDQTSETRQSNEELDLKEIERNEPIQKSNETDEVPQLDEPAVQPHEGTFEDSIESLEDEKCDFGMEKDLDKNIKSSYTSEEDEYEKRITDNVFKPSEAQPELVTNESVKGKKRVLPSWMVKPSPIESATKGKKNATKSSPRGACKRKNKYEGSFEKVGRVEESKSAKLYSTPKRSKQEDQSVQDVREDSKLEINPKESESKCVESKDVENQISDSGNKDNVLDVTKSGRGHELMNPIDNEKRKFEMTFSEESEDIGVVQLRGNDKGDSSMLEGRKSAENIPKIANSDDNIPKIATSNNVKSINRSNEEILEIRTPAQSVNSVEEGFTAKAEEIKKKLPKCAYGKSCYRRNPVHFQEYSHPDVEGDGGGATGAEDLPECPYGTSCYRQNPQHKLEYKHTKIPSGQHSSTRKAKRKSFRQQNRPKMSVLDNASDDDGEGNDYDYDDSFIDDDNDGEFEGESSSSYEDDNDDDENWSPQDLE